MGERGVAVVQAKVHRRALKILPRPVKLLHSHKSPVGRSWLMDGTYIRVGGQWRYLYRAVDLLGQTVDFRLTADLDLAAARRLIERAIDP